MLKRAGVAAIMVGAAITAWLPGTALGQIAYTTCFTGLAVAAWSGVRRPSAGGRSPWVMIAAAMTAWLAGDLVFAGLELAGPHSAVGAQDVLWLAGYAFMGAAIVAMVRQRAPGQAWAGFQDGLTLTTAAALATWQFLVAPGLDTSTPTLQLVVSALYPFGDLVLLASVLFLVLSPGRRGGPIRLLVAGTVATLALDLAFTVLPNFWPTDQVDRLDGGLLLANGLVVAAALCADRDVLVTPVRMPMATMHPARVLFLGIALLTAPLMAVSRDSLALDDRILLLGGTTITIAFCLARFTGAVREQARAQLQLSHLADHDALTGLANRRVLDECLDVDFEPRDDMLLLYIDLDGFKAINDEYGHTAGDAVLINVARRLRAVVRSRDIVARLGGDEFAVLCYAMDPVSGHHLAERLRLAVADPIAVDGHLLNVGASIGLAAATGCSDGYDLISRADRAMFEAKRGGRGRLAAA